MFASPGSFALLPSSLLVKVVQVEGSATNTITELVPINEITFLIKAEQVGYLSHFGNFTGEFSYVATGTPVSIVLVGDATLTNTRGEQLFVTATIVELGTDYPYAVSGTLVVTGGTGRFSASAGTIAVTGTDEESLVDAFHLKGALVIVGGS
ncbi:MAG: hypothetical protein ACREH8_06220 [Opitutaceae bacterium]